MLTQYVNAVDIFANQACTGDLLADERLRMLLTAGLAVLLDTSGGVVGNARADHPLAIFRVRLRDLEGLTGASFLFGIAVSVVVSLADCGPADAIHPTESSSSNSKGPALLPTQ